MTGSLTSGHNTDAINCLLARVIELLNCKSWRTFDRVGQQVGQQVCGIRRFNCVTICIRHVHNLHLIINLHFQSSASRNYKTVLLSILLIIQWMEIRWDFIMQNHMYVIHTILFCFHTLRLKFTMNVRRRIEKSNRYIQGDSRNSHISSNFYITCLMNCLMKNLFNTKLYGLKYSVSIFEIFKVIFIFFSP